MSNKNNSPVYIEDETLFKSLGKVDPQNLPEGPSLLLFKDEEGVSYLGAFNDQPYVIIAHSIPGATDTISFDLEDKTLYAIGGMHPELTEVNFVDIISQEFSKLGYSVDLSKVTIHASVFPMATFTALAVTEK